MSRRLGRVPEFRNQLRTAIAERHWRSAQSPYHQYDSFAEPLSLASAA